MVSYLQGGGLQLCRRPPPDFPQNHCKPCHFDSANAGEKTRRFHSDNDDKKHKSLSHNSPLIQGLVISSGVLQMLAVGFGKSMVT